MKDEEELLLREHSRIIERQARRAHRHIHGMDLDDLRQHARIAALAAIRSYDERHGLSLAVWIH